MRPGGIENVKPRLGTRANGMPLIRALVLQGKNTHRPRKHSSTRSPAFEPLAAVCHSIFARPHANDRERFVPSAESVSKTAAGPDPVRHRTGDNLDPCSARYRLRPHSAHTRARGVRSGLPQVRHKGPYSART